MKLKRYTQFLESKSDMWDIIPDSVKELHKLFQDKGRKLYLVGGSVRDFLTGDKPKDFDLATDALPDEVLDIVDGKFRKMLINLFEGDIDFYFEKNNNFINFNSEIIEQLCDVENDPISPEEYQRFLDSIRFIPINSLYRD